LRTDGISDAREFVVSGRAFFVLRDGCVVVSVSAESPAFGCCFNVNAAAGIGLGSIDGGRRLVLRDFLRRAYGAVATFCAGWSHPTS